MRNNMKQHPAPLEQERQELVEQGRLQMSDELKMAVDLAYKLSVKKISFAKVVTLTNGTGKQITPKSLI